MPSVLNAICPQCHLSSIPSVLNAICLQYRLSSMPSIVIGRVSITPGQCCGSLQLQSPLPFLAHILEHVHGTQCIRHTLWEHSWEPQILALGSPQSTDLVPLWGLSVVVVAAMDRDLKKISPKNSPSDKVSAITLTHSLAR